LEFEGLPSSKNQFSAVAHPQESGAAAGRLSAEPKVLDQRRKLDFKKFQRAKLANLSTFEQSSKAAYGGFPLCGKYLRTF